MAIVFNDATSAVLAAITEYFGPIPSGISSEEVAAINQRRTELAQVIATVAVYVQQNAVVNAGIPVTVSPSSGVGDTTGTGTLS